MLGVLAQSPHGRTYRAEGPGGVVALKELVFALVPTAEQLDAFEREAKVLESLSHPQIPRFVESFREGEGPALRLYLAQELVEGEPLVGRLRAGAIDEAEARGIARQLLQILRYLHERGIVHRDVKPANVLRRPDGTLVLVDFGAARALEGVTYGATLVGTFGYMPPEQLGGTVDATSDLYALGATLVHLLGRKAPADILGPDLELRLDHLRVSPGFRTFLGKLTARKRSSRPPTAAEALRVLDHPEAPPRRIRAKLPFVIAGAGALALLAAAGAFVHAVVGSLPRADPNADRARRAMIEALDRELSSPPKVVTPPAPPPDQPDHRDVSMGRLLNGERLLELDQGLPPCYRRAGIELARVRHWPAQKALQLKVVLHSQNPDCDWMALEVRAFTSNGRSLRLLGAHGDAPRDGWREAFYDFELPQGVGPVTLQVGGPTRPLEAWRLDLDRPEVRRVGYALAGRIEAPQARVDVPTGSGCARLEHGSLENLWIEQAGPGRKQLELHATFSTRKETKEPCAPGSRLVLLEPRSEVPSAFQLESERTVKFTLALPDGRNRIRVALGRSAALRIDLQSATAEQEAHAAVDR
ncbi:MAG TPA: serine/threonine-protein kinase [Myxococcales bacterium]|nr:serine/threonine-protein kinase [Myxococcales bacterium]